MVAPVAVAAGKQAADNPAGTIFLAVLVGAVLLQGVKNLPNLGDFLWNKLPILPDIDVTAPIDYTMEAIETTAALNEEVYEGIAQISKRKQDPLENFIFGDDVEVYEPGEIGTIQQAYQGARNNLFIGAWSRGGSLY